MFDLAPGLLPLAGAQGDDKPGRRESAPGRCYREPDGLTPDPRSAGRNASSSMKA